MGRIPNTTHSFTKQTANLRPQRPKLLFVWASRALVAQQTILHPSSKTKPCFSNILSWVTSLVFSEKLDVRKKGEKPSFSFYSANKQTNKSLDLLTWFPPQFSYSFLVPPQQKRMQTYNGSQAEAHLVGLCFLGFPRK